MENLAPAEREPNGENRSEVGSGLAVEGLTKRFGSLTAVDRLSFSVRPGQILALLGPNGAGKTTTLLCLAGLLRPDQGRIAWQGATLGPERSRSMALIPETPEVYEMLTVWEHLVFTAKSCRVASGWEERARGLIERLDLSPKRDTLGDNLSKGMRQKLLLACAVLAGTPVMLLDEPMIGLDPRGQRELKDLLLELRQQGTAIIVSTHLLEYIDALCDELLILKEGHKMAAGPLREVLAERGGRSLEDVFLEITR
jgi:ABC-2 type transport system ATP-binding protein